MTTLMGWLFASSSILIGFLVTRLQTSAASGVGTVRLVSKVGVVALATGIVCGVFYITTLITSLKDRPSDIVINRKILAASTLLLHLALDGGCSSAGI
jgi:hypothetical protein